jgi:hypothetical protein
MLVEEGLAHGWGHDLPFDALEDSLRLFLDATRIPVMKRLAHAVVEGRVVAWDVPPPERKSPSLRRFSFKLAVAQVLHQRSGPRIPQDTLLVVSPAVRDGGGGIYGTKASIQVGEDYMLFLRWDGGEWLDGRPTVHGEKSGMPKSYEWPRGSAGQEDRRGGNGLGGCGTLKD